MIEIDEATLDEISQSVYGVPHDELNAEQLKNVKREAEIFLQERQMEKVQIKQ